MALDLVELTYPAHHVLQVHVRRPDRRNAIDADLANALADALTKPAARVVLLTTEGSTFCAGYDLRALGDPAEAAYAKMVAVESPLFSALDSCPVPTVAAIQGQALGGGLELALACDLRIAGRSASFGVPAGRIGLVYPHTGVERILRAVGPAHTRELLLLAEPIDAQTALAWGVVQRLADDAALLSDAIGVAVGVASLVPVSQAGNLKVIRLVERSQTRLTASEQAKAEELRRNAFGSAEFAAAIAAFARRSPPKSEGR